MVTVYCNEITSRVSYTFNIIFNRILGVEVFLIGDQEAFDKVKGPKFVYGANANADELFIKSYGLLYEDGLVEQNISVAEYEGNHCFFGVDDSSSMPFDPFSAAFYMLSRYEEYLPHEKDDLGRFPPTQSLAFKYGFLRKPIVQIWALQLAKLIKSRFAEFDYSLPDFSFINTIDVDNAYAYKGKGLWRTLGGIGRSIITLNANDLFMRLGVLLFGSDDPYDTFSMIGQLTKEYSSKTICFILQGKYGRYDKNLKHTSSHQISAIKKLVEFSDIGVHPSFASNKHPEYLKVEKGRLESIIQFPITKSRQHYLVLSFPATYQRLIDHGITDDYSMGYAAEPGFRAGLSIPFPFYDLQQEKETELTLHPFAVMDRALEGYLKITPDQAMGLIEEVVNEVKEVGGQLISIWHNEALNEKGEWRGWVDVYRHLQGCASDY